MSLIVIVTFLFFNLTLGIGEFLETLPIAVGVGTGVIRAIVGVEFDSGITPFVCT